MLRTGLIHPQILEALASAGHGSLVLITDSNFPSLTAPQREARRVYLNLRPGMVSVADVLETLVEVVPIERVALMQPDTGGMPPVRTDVARLLGAETEVDLIERHAFYAATRSEDMALVIITGDDRWYANVLLTIGAVPPPDVPAGHDRSGLPAAMPAAVPEEPSRGRS